MAHGGARRGAGRKPGASTRLNEEARRRAAEGGLMPLDYMLSMLRDETLEPTARFEAAKAAAPYVHAKLANVELNANVAFSHEDALDQLDDDGAGASDQAQTED